MSWLVTKYGDLPPFVIVHDPGWGALTVRRQRAEDVVAGYGSERAVDPGAATIFVDNHRDEPRCLRIYELFR